MKYIHKHLSTAAGLISAYDGTLPLSIYLKQYFAANKKYGGKDRKYIAHFCFVYYRLANAFKDLPIEEAIKVALFICSNKIDDFAALFDDNWVANWHPEVAERIAFVRLVYTAFDTSNIFPLLNNLSEGMDAEAFAVSHVVQPDLFLRIRPNHTTKVVEKLKAANIAFTHLKNDCLALSNTSKIDDILDIDREVVVQDYSSQRIAEFLKIIATSQTINNKLPITVWDCCAASGGKSILVNDVLGNIKLTVSDIRSSIIQNLKARLAKARIAIYHSFIADLTSAKSGTLNFKSQLIICDAPCSGSGTWGRTPEQLHFFKQNDIVKYSNLQQQIAVNAIAHLAPNGYFLYITCSVFKQENEDVVAFVLQQYPSLTLIKKELLIGYDTKADSMFAALFGK